MLQKQKIMFTLVSVGFLLAACSGSRPTDLGIQDAGTLAPCPDKPNCVSSFASPDDAHFIAPIKAGEKEWQRLPRILADMPRITITEQKERYLRAEAKTLIMRFVDDLEFLYYPEESLIHIRSASRIGYSDFGVNRKRIERLREKIADY